MIERLHPAYAVFWVAYIIVVNFAVMRVVAALFLKTVMSVASVDADRVAMEKMKEKEKYALMLQQVFEMADTSGDGAINKEEFDVMCEDRRIEALFAKMEVDMQEVTML